MKDSEIGKLWRRAIHLQARIKSWSYEPGYEGPSVVINLIIKLVEERAQTIAIIKNEGFTTPYDGDRHKACGDFGIPWAKYKKARAENEKF